MVSEFQNSLTTGPSDSLTVASNPTRSLIYLRSCYYDLVNLDGGITLLLQMCLFLATLILLPNSQENNMLKHLEIHLIRGISVHSASHKKN